MEAHMEGHTCRHTHLDTARLNLLRARRLLERSRSTPPFPRIVHDLQQSVLSLMKQDLQEWGLAPRALENDSRAVSAMSVMAPREPRFRAHLQLLGLVVVLEQRSRMEQSESGWQRWRRDALALVSRLERCLMPEASAGRRTASSVAGARISAAG